MKNPDKFGFSTVSAAAWVTLAFKSWAFQNDVKMRQVDYSSGAEAATAVLGKHGDISFLFPNNYGPLVDAGKLKLLALGSKSEKYPDVPSFADLGYKGTFYAWSGIVVPKGVPQEIIDKLAAVSDKISKDPEYIKAIENLGFKPDNTSGAQWKKEVMSQYADMKVLLQELGFVKK